MCSRWLALWLTVLWSPADGSGCIGRSFVLTRSLVMIVVTVISGRACLRVDLAARLAFPSSVTGISASLQASALPGASTFFFHIDQNCSFRHQGVWLSCQGDLHCGLVRHPALHGCAQDRHPQVLHPPILFTSMKLLLVKECDRDPSTGAGFPPL